MERERPTVDRHAVAAHGRASSERLHRGAAEGPRDPRDRRGGAVLLIAGTGAASASSPSPSASSGEVIFRVGVLEYVDSLNPFIGYSGVDYSVYHLNYDFLVGFEPQKLQPRPEFAESWTSSADGKTWTFKIRSGMTWQDGEPATARDAAFTFNYILDNDLSTFTGYLTFVKTVTAPDDTTLVIE